MMGHPASMVLKEWMADPTASTTPSPVVRLPRITVAYITASASSDGSSRFTPLRCSQRPMPTAMGI